MTAWYDLPPADYARGLRYRAEASEGCASHWSKQDGALATQYAERYRHQARRLRAMATLCDRSDAHRAGDVDFHDLGDPTMAHEIEEEIIREIEEDAHKT